MAAAYVGTCLVPPLFGLIAQYINIGLYPVFMAVILVLMVIMSEKLHIAVLHKDIEFRTAEEN